MNRIIFIIPLLFLLAFFSCKGLKEKEKVFDRTFTPEWESLITNDIPQWLMDAKFGIYAHWGVYTVPAFETEWYGKRMYELGSDVHAHHLKTYGDPSEFGYKDFIPMFRAENYDPAEWASLIRESGARYAGFAVVHHDGFCLWDSKYTRWNSRQMGPERDLYGELVSVLRKNDLKVISTFHHIRTFNWYIPWIKDFFAGADSIMRQSYVNKNWDIFNPEYGDLYWNEEVGMKREDFLKEWRNKVTEVIDNYKPDLIWFDGGAFRDSEAEFVVKKLLSYYYNKQKEWQKPLVVLNKLPVTLQFNFPEEFGMLTFEEGRDRGEMIKRPWVDDMKISDRAWSYIEGQKYKPAKEIIHGLIDRVSRGGGLLLNISPMADGTIPTEQKIILHETGQWLKINGEAIFDTRPWTVHSEGPVEKFISPGTNPRWNFSDNCDAGDIRYTSKNNILYLMALGWSEDLTLKSKSLNSAKGNTENLIKEVKLLGSEGTVRWKTNNEGTLFYLPEVSNHIAPVLKIELIENQK